MSDAQPDAAPEPRGRDAPSAHGPLEPLEAALARASRVVLHTAELALRLPEPARSRWHRAGVSARTERIFDFIAGALLVVFAVGWTWSIGAARAAAAEAGISGVTASIAAALTDPAGPTAAYLTNAALDALTPLRGESGKLRAHVQQAGEPLPERPLPTGAELRVASGADSTGLAAPPGSGVWRLALKVGAAIKPVTDLNVIALTPFSEKRRGRIGLYYIGSWPGERGRARRSGYANPSGFIEVTPANQDTYVSEHFRLRDFLTKDQQNVWPKYLVLELRLVDKLELVLADLASRGYRVAGVQVMSGFRTPQYNETGGDPSGRGALSRHMYGDAADIFIDNDGNGTMDDLNGDRRVNLRDAQVILQSVDRVERAHPALVGGAGVYPAASGHGPFIHIDTRGFRARWVEARSD
ncbi:MAG TPA: hypothetical protein VNA89_08810 [Gemmatimonadaceae bacterium]|nr:hypothetical protein [Gemmatimonadaceae bacterium]